MEQEVINMEKVLIIGVELNSDKTPIQNSLDELEELVIAAGGQVVSRLSQKMNAINAADRKSVV